MPDMLKVSTGLFLTAVVTIASPTGSTKVDLPTLDPTAINDAGVTNKHNAVYWALLTVALVAAVILIGLCAANCRTRKAVGIYTGPPGAPETTGLAREPSQRHVSLPHGLGKPRPRNQSLPDQQRVNETEAVTCAQHFVTSNGDRREFTVVKVHAPGSPDEIALVVGNTVILKAVYEDGWAFGVSTRSGGGFFPVVCLGGSVPRVLVQHAATKNLEKPKPLYSWSKSAAHTKSVREISVSHIDTSTFESPPISHAETTALPLSPQHAWQSPQPQYQSQNQASQESLPIQQHVPSLPRRYMTPPRTISARLSTQLGTSRMSGVPGMERLSRGAYYQYADPSRVSYKGSMHMTPGPTTQPSVTNRAPVPSMQSMYSVVSVENSATM
ncbi:hypothetical protein HKX48_005174 [Thoreauomyces humboldtii]|nr:hypothetical protein HKX48_005174 [Thoreauomyces humboldtii]